MGRDDAVVGRFVASFAWRSGRRPRPDRSRRAPASIRRSRRRRRRCSGCSCAWSRRRAMPPAGVVADARLLQPQPLDVGRASERVKDLVGDDFAFVRRDADAHAPSCRRAARRRSPRPRDDVDSFLAKYAGQRVADVVVGRREQMPAADASMVVRAPIRDRNCPSSHAVYPPPSTTTDFGNAFEFEHGVAIQISRLREPGQRRRRRRRCRWR